MGSLVEARPQAELEWNHFVKGAGVYVMYVYLAKTDIN